MPRVTRAALRLNAMSEEANLAASTPLPLTPLPHRVPLGEITGNSEEVKSMINDLEQLVKVHKKAPPKGRRGKESKKEQMLAMNAKSEECVEVIEDDNQSAKSSAVDEACQELMKEPSGEIHQVVVHDQRPRTPPSPAVTALRKHLSSPTRTSNACSIAARSGMMVLTDLQKDENGYTKSSNVEAPGLPSTEYTDMEPGNRDQMQEDLPENDDLILEHIMTRSPVETITRIEDSVEAIDAFEEAIEKVGELIPAIPKGRRSPTKTKKAGSATRDSNHKNAGPSTSDSKRATKPSRPLIVTSKRITTQANGAIQKRTSAPLSSQLTSETVEGSDVVMAAVVGSTSSVKDAVGGQAKSKRISSIHSAPFQPTKSAKPPTRSNFELPGEAVARKLKEQREERLKREEAEVAKKPVLKSRPARLSQAPVVRQTTTSSARLSLAQNDFKKVSPLQERMSAQKSLSRQGSISNADARKRLSSISQVQRSRSDLNKVTMSQRSPPSISSTAQASAGVVGPSRTSITASDAIQLKLRGKEVFNRNRVELDERERARKEKEEAARKARAEASERGRIASREWAEKQRIKKMATVKESRGE